MYTHIFVWADSEIKTNVMNSMKLDYSYETIHLKHHHLHFT